MAAAWSSSMPAASLASVLQLPSGGFVQTQNTKRYYVSVSYRIDFQR